LPTDTDAEVIEAVGELRFWGELRTMTRRDGEMDKGLEPEAVRLKPWIQEKRAEKGRGFNARALAQGFPCTRVVLEQHVRPYFRLASAQKFREKARFVRVVIHVAAPSRTLYNGSMN
jgi:hypothetical protein